MLNTLRFLGVVIGSALFALGSAKALLTGLASGEFLGKKGAAVASLHASPVKFVLAALFFAAVSAGFSALTYHLFRKGPEGLARMTQEVDEERRAKAAARAQRTPGKLPYIASGVLFAMAVGLTMVTLRSRDGADGYLTLFSALYAFGCAVGGVIALAFSKHRAVSKGALLLLGALVVASVFFK